MVDNNPATRQGWTIPILVSLAILLPQILPLVSRSGATAGTAGGTIGSAWLANGMIQSLSQVMLLAVIIGVSGRSREFGVYKPRPRDVPIATLILGAMLLIGSIFTLIATTLGFAPNEASTGAPGETSWTMVALSVGFALASAYREELFYRVYLLGSFKQRSAPQAAAVAISVALFAWGHTYQGPSGMAASACIGLFLALAWIKGTSVHALAWGHAAYNLGILLTLNTG